MSPAPATPTPTLLGFLKRHPLLIMAAALALLMLRRFDAFSNPQFWAEDFAFIIDAEKNGARTFITPYAGYLHAIPRTAAYLASFLDPILQPSLFLLTWCTVLLAVLFSCLSDRLDLPRKPWLALAVLIVPGTGEVFFNPTNAQWVAALGLFLTFLKNDPKSASDWLADLGFLLFSGLSGPFIILLTPFFAARAWRRRSAASILLLVGAIALSATQYWFISHSPPDREFVGPFNFFNLLVSLALRLPAHLFLGFVATDFLLGKLAVVIAGGLLMAFVVIAALRLEKHRWAACSMLAFVVLLLASTTLRKRFDLWDFGGLQNGDRYFFIPKVVTLWAIGLMTSARLASVRGPAWLLLAACVTLNAPRFRFQPFRDCQWYEKCPAIRRAEQVIIEINPGWKFRYRRYSTESFGPYL